MANHSDPRTTKLCDRSRDEVPLDEVEGISVYWRGVVLYLAFNPGGA
jgi:hypothetical protein